MTLEAEATANAVADLTKVIKMTIAMMIMTSDQLIKRIVEAVASSTSSLKEAANDIFALKKQGMTQQEIGDAVGKSVGWVSAMLAWKKDRFKDESPFGPTTKQGRVQHAEQKKAAKRGNAPPPETEPPVTEPPESASDATEMPGNVVPMTTTEPESELEQEQAAAESKRSVFLETARREFESACEKYFEIADRFERAEAIQFAVELGRSMAKAASKAA